MSVQTELNRADPNRLADLLRTANIGDVLARLAADVFVGKGLTTRQIASWLKSSHSVDTTYKTVAKLLARTRTERSEIAKVVLRDKLSGSLTTDIDRLEK